LIYNKTQYLRYYIYDYNPSGLEDFNEDRGTGGR